MRNSLANSRVGVKVVHQEWLVPGSSSFWRLSLRANKERSLMRVKRKSLNSYLSSNNPTVMNETLIKVNI